MQSNDELMSQFSQYRQDGLITPAEFSQAARHLLDAAAPPDWILRLAKACSLAQKGEIGPDDLREIKREIFSPMADTLKNAGATANLAIRQSEGANIVRICTGVACIIGLVPLPMADAPFLIITQYIMLKKLCAKYNREPGYSLALIVVSALLGPLIFTAFIKRIPYAGSIVGACVAALFTWFIGKKTLVMLERGWEFSLRNFIKAVIGAK